MVVHGPLNLIHMLDFWRDVRGTDEGCVPRSVTYRATSPLYVGEPYRILLGRMRERISEASIVDEHGAVAMTGKIEAF